jgi:hypothetical protein
MRPFPFLKPYRREADWIDKLIALKGEELFELLRNFYYEIDDGENLIRIKLVGVKDNEALLIHAEGWSWDKKINVKRLYEIWLL